MHEEMLDLRDILRVIQRYRKIVFYTLGLAIVIAIALNLMPPTYEAHVNIRIKYPQNNGESTGYRSPEEVMKEYLYTYSEIVKSRTVVEGTIDKVFAGSEAKPSYDDFVGAIDAQPVKNTDILRVSVLAKSPEQAVLIANTLTDEFNQRLTAMVRTEGRDTRVFIGERLQDVKRDLDKAEKALVEFKKANQIVSMPDETRNMVERYAELKKMAVDNQLAMQSSMSRLNSVSSQLSSQNPNFIADSPLIAQYKGQLASQEIELVGLLKNYTEAHPRVIALRAAIAETRARLQDEIVKVARAEAPSSSPLMQTMLQNKIQAEVDINTAQAQRGALERVTSEGEKDLSKLPTKEQALARLMMDYTVAQDIYSMLAKRHEESRISEVMVPTNVQVVDRASLPDRPVKPRKFLNLVAGVFLGLFIGVILTFVFNYFYKTIDVADDVRRQLGLQVIGNIPDFDAVYKRKTRSVWDKLFAKVKTQNRGGSV